MKPKLYALMSGMLDFLALPRPTQLRVRSLSLDTLLSLALYDGSLPYHDPRVRALVWEIKYHAEPRAAALAGEYLADLLLAYAADDIGKPLLVPMPMHTSRRAQRGHNQTELLCEAALEKLSPPTPATTGVGFDYSPDMLVRVRNTPLQQGLERHARLQNVKNSMQVTDTGKRMVAGRVCIVVDDVSTTGASFAEARRVLRLAGARAIHCVALAQS